MENYTNHINKYANSTAIQAALDNGSLANPYVAMTTAGTLDFNSLQPTPPAPATMGYWESGSNTFHITEQDYNYWLSNPLIGEILNSTVAGTTDTATMNLTIDNGTYTLTMKQVEGSDEFGYEFYENTPGQGIGTDFGTGGGSDDQIMFDWNGSDELYFYVVEGGQPININKIDPEYPAA